jgi:type I restriction enzyme S subunit
MSTALLLREFERVAEVPGATECFRSFIVELALRGDLTASDPVRLSAEPVNLDHILQGMESLVDPRPRYRWAKNRLAPSPQFEFPQGWLATELANTGLYINGIAFKPSDWGTSGRPIIRIQNLSGFNRDYNYAIGDFPEDNLVNTGDLLVSWSATLDTYLWKGPQGVVNQHIFKVIPNLNAVTPRFLYWLLKHEVRQLANSQHAHGLAMMHINRGPFLEHAVLLPPLVEQHRIVAKVEELMALYDRLEAAQNDRECQRDALRAASLHRLIASEAGRGVDSDVRLFFKSSPRLITRPEHVAPIRKAILDLAVRGRLVQQDTDDQPASSLIADIQRGRVRVRKGSSSEPVGNEEETFLALPPGWAMTTIGSLFDIYVGATPSRDDPSLWNGDIPWVSSGEVAFNRIKSTRESITARAVGDSITRLHPPGTVMLGMIGQGKTRGQPAILDVAAAHNQNCASIRVSATPIPSEFIYWVLAQRYEVTRVLAEGGSQPALNGNKVRSIPLALPPLAEQHRIVAKVDTLMSVCDELEMALSSTQVARARLLLALLHDSLNGSGSYVPSLTTQQSAQKKSPSSA